MRHLCLFETEAEFNGAKETLAEPWVALTMDNGSVCYSDGGEEVSVVDPMTKVWYNDGTYQEYHIVGEITSTGNYSPTDMIANPMQMTRIEIGSDVTDIADYAFYYCFNLTDVVINSNGSIGTSSFGDSYNITSVTIGDGVTEIGENAFSGCNSISELTLGNSVNKIGDSSFSSCKITELVIPKSVKEIGHSAFSNCTNLVNLTLYDTIEIIWYSAFASTAIETVNIPKDCVYYKGNQPYHYNVFDYCENLTSFTYDGKLYTDSKVWAEEYGISDKDREFIFRNTPLY